MTDRDAALPREEMRLLAEQLTRRNGARPADDVGWLENALGRAVGKEFLLIHNPGGWGNAVLQDCQEWERSIVDGVIQTMNDLGRSWALVQYFRSGDSFWRHMQEIRREMAFFFRGQSAQAETMAVQLKFLVEHLKGTRVILVGASQGAAFSNTVMRHLAGFPGVYSVELGIFFPHMSRRVVTERTLAIDSNGFMPDPMANRTSGLGPART